MSDFDIIYYVGVATGFICGAIIAALVVKA